MTPPGTPPGLVAGAAARPRGHRESVRAEEGRRVSERTTVDPNWIGPQEDQGERRILRWSLGFAAIVHGVLFLVHFPTAAREPAAPEPERAVYVMQQVRFRPPPPPDPQRPIPARRARRVPMPDPTPDAPEPVREPRVEVDLEIPDVDELVLAEIEVAPPLETGPVWVRGDVQRPEKIDEVMPVYTEIARKARIQGHVVLQTVIDKHGNVEDIKVLKGLPMGLTAAAVDAVSRWRYRPATLNGMPVAVYFNLTVQFALQG